MGKTILAFATAAGLLWLAWLCVAEIREVRRRRAGRAADLVEADAELPAEGTADSQADDEDDEDDAGDEWTPEPTPESNVIGLAVAGSALLFASACFFAGGIYRVAGGPLPWPGSKRQQRQDDDHEDREKQDDAPQVFRGAS